MECVLGNAERSLIVVFEYSPQYPADEAFMREGIEWVKNVALGE